MSGIVASHHLDSSFNCWKHEGPATGTSWRPLILPKYSGPIPTPSPASPHSPQPPSASSTSSSTSKRDGNWFLSHHHHHHKKSDGRHIRNEGKEEEEEEVSGVVMSETKNSIEQVKSTFMCAYSHGGIVRIWDGLHSGTSIAGSSGNISTTPSISLSSPGSSSTPQSVRAWPPVDLEMEMDHVRFLVNTWYLVALSRDGSLCRIIDLRSGGLHMTVETLEPNELLGMNKGEESSSTTAAAAVITCVADADPFLFLGWSDGTIAELHQDEMGGGSWVIGRVFNCPQSTGAVTALHCTAIADRQSTKLFLCAGTESGSVLLCSKTVHSSEEMFQLLVTASGHHREAITQVLVTESVETSGLIFSSCSSGGYVRSWHYALEIPHEPTAVMTAATMMTGTPGTAGGMITPPNTTSTGGTLRCICTISRVATGAGGAPLLCELLKVARPSVSKDNLKKHQSQLLVTSNPNNSLTIYDLGEFATSSGKGPIVTIHPVDRAAVTSCCVTSTTSSSSASSSSTSSNMLLRLITGHSNGCLQVWDLNAALHDPTKSTPLDLVVY